MRRTVSMLLATSTARRSSLLSLLGWRNLLRCCSKLKAENKEIIDLLVGLTVAYKTWGFDLFFLIFAMSKATLGTTSAFVGSIANWS
jgi:hypothetical protein